MATPIFQGGATAVAQVNTETPDASPATNDVYTLVLTNRTGETNSISFAVGATQTVQAVVEGLKAAAVAAKSAGDDPWDEVTCTEDDTAVTITADVAGEPFFVTASAAGGGSPTLTDSVETACEGPGIYSDADNWNGNAAAVAADDAKIPAGISQTIYGEDASATELATFEVERGNTSAIGHNDKPLQVDATDSFDLAGTGETYLSVTGPTCTVNVNAAGIGSGTGTYGLNLTGGEAGMVVNIRAEANQRIGIAARAGKTFTGATVNVYGGEVRIGSGATLSALNVYGGTVTCAASIATVVVEGGTLTLTGAAACGTSLTVKGSGRCYEESTGTKAAVIIAGSGRADATDCPGATWSSSDLYGTDCLLVDPNKKLTLTGHTTLNYARSSQVDRGTHMNVAFTTAS